MSDDELTLWRKARETAQQAPIECAVPPPDSSAPAAAATTPVPAPASAPPRVEHRASTTTVTSVSRRLSSLHLACSRRLSSSMLAQRLNELADANANGLLECVLPPPRRAIARSQSRLTPPPPFASDDEYRLLRQSLFERMTAGTAVPQEVPVVPTAGPSRPTHHVRDSCACASLARLPARR